MQSISKKFFIHSLYFFSYYSFGLFFFFSSRRRHTIFSRDWSSDVCSSDLAETRIGPAYGGPTFYAKDAMSGLRIMNDLADPAKRRSALGSHIFPEEREIVRDAPPSPLPATRSSRVRTELA